MGKVDFDAIRTAVEAEDSATDKRRKPPEDRTYFKWSAALTDKLTALVDQQKTAEEISAELGVPLDKVKSKLAALKAKVPTALKTTTEPVASMPMAETTELLHIPAEPQGAKPKQNELLDRVVFYALDELVLRLQADGEDPAMTFRCALDMLDLWAEGLREQIEYMPAAMAHFAAIGAIMAYQKITGKKILVDADGIEKAACRAGTL